MIMYDSCMTHVCSTLKSQISNKIFWSLLPLLQLWLTIQGQSKAHGKWCEPFLSYVYGKYLYTYVHPRIYIRHDTVDILYIA